MSTRSRNKLDTKEDIIKKGNVTEIVSVFLYYPFFIYFNFFYLFGLVLRNRFLLKFLVSYLRNS
jgi:hypothetical protein